MRSPPAFQVCTAADDKTAAVEDFLRYLYGAMASDAIWQYASEEQLQDAQMAIERSVMNRIFKLAFYPNQDGDILRDQWVTAAPFYRWKKDYFFPIEGSNLYYSYTAS